MQPEAEQFRWVPNSWFHISFIELYNFRDLRKQRAR